MRSTGTTNHSDPILVDRDRSSRGRRHVTEVTAGLSKVPKLPCFRDRHPDVTCYMSGHDTYEYRP